MPGYNGILFSAVTFDHFDQYTKNLFKGILAANPNGGGVIIPGNGMTLTNCGTATLVNGVVKITTGDGGPLTLQAKSRIGLSVYTYDNVDVPILAITARVNGAAGSGNPASFTVSSKKDENSSFDWYVFN